MSQTNSISNDQILSTTIGNVARGMEKVGPTIDKMTSASLKRILKTITHVHLAEEILEGNTIQLSQEEQSLVSYIFNLQEDVMGYIQLRNELDNENKEGETNE